MKEPLTTKDKIIFIATYIVIFAIGISAIYGILSFIEFFIKRI